MSGETADKKLTIIELLRAFAQNHAGTEILCKSKCSSITTTYGRVSLSPQALRLRLTETLGFLPVLPFDTNNATDNTYNSIEEYLKMN